MEPAKVNSGFNAPQCFRNCSLFVRLPYTETRRPRLGRETKLLERIDGNLVVLASRLGLRLHLPREAVCDWLSGSVGDLRRTGSISGSPRTGWVSGFEFSYGRTCKPPASAGPPGPVSGPPAFQSSPGPWPPGSGLTGLLAPVSSPFDPEECHRCSARAWPAGVIH